MSAPSTVNEGMSLWVSMRIADLVIGIAVALPFLRNRIVLLRIERVLHRRFDRLVMRRKRPVLEAVGQRLAFEVLHDQKIGTVLMTDVVERADVRMAQAGYGFGFPVEAFARMRIA